MKVWGNELVVSEVVLFFAVLIIFPLFFLYTAVCHLVDYRIMKRYYLRKNKWDLNICCGNTNGGGINADIVKRDVPNFALVDDIYNLPFKDGQFERTLCSHTMEHVEQPERFFEELKRISKDVVLLVPPLWDILAMAEFKEHKWQFQSLKIKHENSLPGKFKLPYWGIQKRFGQQYRC